MHMTWQADTGTTSSATRGSTRITRPRLTAPTDRAAPGYAAKMVGALELLLTDDSPGAMLHLVPGGMPDQRR